jgi:hypothetical protein
VEQRERMGYQTPREIGTESFCGEVENHYSPSQSCEAQGYPTLREIQVSYRHGIVHLALEIRRHQICMPKTAVS